MTEHESKLDADDADIARLLQAAGAREALPEELRGRWEQRFRAELAEARPARRWRFALPVAAIAASVVALLLVFDDIAVTPVEAFPVKVVAVAGSGDVYPGDDERLAAAAGQSLATGAIVQTGRESRLALDWAGFDVRLNANTRVELGSDRLLLVTGEVYVSDIDRQTQLPWATVQTPLATVRDLGTQFKVRYDAGTLTTSVRAGSVLLAIDQVEHRADAVPGAGRTVVLGADESVVVSVDSSDWSWIYPVAERFRLEGRTLEDFLRWSVAESGRQLSFADELTEFAARGTRFSGAVDMEALDPDQAVDLVLSTTRFTAAREPGVLLVSRRSERQGNSD